MDRLFILVIISVPAPSLRGVYRLLNNCRGRDSAWVEKLNDINQAGGGSAILTDEAEKTCPILDEIAGMCDIHPFEQ